MSIIRYVFYFSPHQDDELLNLGAAICKDIDAGLDVFCVLCTDGGGSGARRLIGDGGCCQWHEGRHDYPMDRAAFSAARDREFTESCLAMGLQQDRVIISPDRMADGASTVKGVKQIILNAIKDFPPDRIAVKTLAPVPWRHQNVDHTALAKAAGELFAEQRFMSLDYYLETILLPPPEETVIETVIPDAEQKRRLRQAAESYRKWDPAHGRYAVGRHSVYDEFADFEKKPYAYREEKTT